MVEAKSKESGFKREGDGGLETVVISPVTRFTSETVVRGSDLAASPGFGLDLAGRGNEECRCHPLYGWGGSFLSR